MADPLGQLLAEHAAAPAPTTTAWRQVLVLVLVLVGTACGDPEIHRHERIVSAGCAVQHLLLMAVHQRLVQG